MKQTSLQELTEYTQATQTLSLDEHYNGLLFVDDDDDNFLANLPIFCLFERYFQITLFFEGVLIRFSALCFCF